MPSLWHRDISLIKADIELQKSTVEGYGVFAKQKIAADQIIEECPVLLVNHECPGLINYCFSWDKPDTYAVALGYGCLYNHSKKPNAITEHNYERMIITVKALTPIATGEEIYISYGNEWFKDRNIKEVRPITEKEDNLLFLGKILLVVLVAVLISWLFK